MRKRCDKIIPLTQRNGLLQIESCIHIQVQRQFEQWLATETSLNVADSQFIGWIHQQFYAPMPDELRWVSDPTHQTQVEVIAGQLRDCEVPVGRHIPPRHDSLARFLKIFSAAYSPTQSHGAKKGSDAILCDVFTLSPGSSPGGGGVKTTGTAVLTTPVGGGGKCLSPTLHHYPKINYTQLIETH